MIVYVVNVFYNETEQPQVSRIFEVAEDGAHKEIQKETILYEKVGTVVLACENEEHIMNTLQTRISDKITRFELVSKTDLTPAVIQTMGVQTMGKGEETPIGQIIFQSGI